MVGSFGLKSEVIVPSAVSAERYRLPIFESVESDWFRRGRRGTGHPARPAAGPEPAPAWVSPADAGFAAAEVASTPVSGGTTEAGLPKRVPQANLVPGAVGAASAPGPAPARSAHRARQRLASFQRGVREGRAAAQTGDTVPGTEDGGDVLSGGSALSGINAISGDHVLYDACRR
jgi:hypothetical protein